MNVFDAKLSELGLELPTLAKPVANYVGWTRCGNTIFTAGQLPFLKGSILHAGKLGGGISIADAQIAARFACLNAIAQIKDACAGDLARVNRVLKVNAYVNCTADFADIPTVVNGASDLLVAIFGESGRHARTSVGVVALPLNACIEIDVVVEAN